MPRIFKALPRFVINSNLIWKTELHFLVYFSMNKDKTGKPKADVKSLEIRIKKRFS